MSSVASFRQIRRRIRSVENTQKITRAMEMVAAAKLRRFQDFLESARPYTEKLEGLLNRLLEEIPAGYDHTFLERVPSPSPLPQGEREIVLVVFTSDTGLCGTYNSEVEESARKWLARNSEKRVSFLFVGKHGANAFHKKAGRVLGAFTDLRVSRVDEILEGLRGALEKAFLNSEAGEIHAVYSKMESLTRYEPTAERILPIPRKAVSEGAGVPTLVEPDLGTVLNRLFPDFFSARLRLIFYHALVTEQIARMSAMRQATQNAEEMIEELTLLRNKARQASITKEIIEIVNGSRALKLK